MGQCQLQPDLFTLERLGGLDVRLEVLVNNPLLAVVPPLERLGVGRYGRRCANLEEMGAKQVRHRRSFRSLGIVVHDVKGYIRPLEGNVGFGVPLSAEGITPEARADALEVLYGRSRAKHCTFLRLVFFSTPRKPARSRLW